MILNCSNLYTLDYAKIFHSFSLICSDLVRLVRDLSKINTISFTNDMSIHAANPSTTLTRLLLNKMPKTTTLHLPHDYLLCLMKSPLIVLTLKKQISSLNIQFYNNVPVLEDVIRIMNIFSVNLLFLTFEIHTELSPNDVYRILPFLLSEPCRKLLIFRLRLGRRPLQELQRFSELMKQILRDYLSAESRKRKTKTTIMEYTIKDSEFFISF